MPDRMWPAVLKFLGYDPFACTDDSTTAERLRAWRRERGLSIKRAAKEIGVDEGTWSKWEAGSLPASQAHRDTIQQLLSPKQPRLG